MKSNLLHILSFACLLLVCVNGQADFKKKFGDELYAEIHKHGIKFFQTALESSQIFYSTVSNELSEERNVTLQQLSHECQELSESINAMKTSELVTAVQNFIPNKFFRILNFETTDYFEGDRLVVIRDAIANCRNKCSQAAKNFAWDVYRVWQQKYPTIPEEELLQHKEYNAINELIQDVEKTDGEGGTFYDVLQLAIRFFNYAEWKAIIHAPNEDTVEKILENYHNRYAK